MNANCRWAAVAVAAMFSGAVQAQMYETCDEALEVFTGQPVMLNNAYARTDDAPQSNCAPSSRDLWLRWTPTGVNADYAVVSTCGSDVDTVVEVYGVAEGQMACPAEILKSIACNDDGCGRQSQVRFPLSDFFTNIVYDEFVIRVGSYAELPGGDIEVVVTADPLPANADENFPEQLPVNVPVVVSNVQGNEDGAPRPIVSSDPALTWPVNLFGFRYYSFTATDTTATITTCGSGGGNTVIKQWFPQYEANDDFCGLLAELQLENLTIGNTYEFVVATYPNAATTFQLEVVSPALARPDSACFADDEACQAPGRLGGYASNGVEFASADDFVLTSDRDVTEVCWWGGYSDGVSGCGARVMDNFSITYRADAGGMPGAVIASFHEDDGSLAVSPAAVTSIDVGEAFVVNEYHAQHAPVSLAGATCYWIEITSDADCGWYWAAAVEGNGRSLLTTPDGVQMPTDLAFCLNGAALADSSGCLPPPPPPVCNQPAANCQAGTVYYGGIPSDERSAVADDFVPGADGTLSGLCWWGFVQPGADTTDFSVTYYVDDAGTPGDVLMSFRESAGTLTVARAPTGESLGGVALEIGYSATHAAVPVAAGGRYWIEIRDLAGDGWLWEYAALDEGNVRAARTVTPLAGYRRSDLIADDLAVCLSVELGVDDDFGVPPTNDDCGSAIPVAANSTTVVDNTFATTGVSEPAFDNCSRGGVASVWYTFTTDEPTVLIHTGTRAGGDSILALYRGECGSLERIACNDDAQSIEFGLGNERPLPLTHRSGLYADLTAFPPGGTYYIQVAAYDEAARGEYELTLRAPSPTAAPANDAYELALDVTVPTVVSGTTVLADQDLRAAPDCDGVLITAPGVWYKVLGTGDRITASLCSPATQIDPKLSVYRLTQSPNPPQPLECVTAAGDLCGARSLLSWIGEPGVEYFVLVHAANATVGDYELTLSGDVLGDLTGDGCVDFGDFAALVADWGPGRTGGDINGDGSTDMSDFSLLATYWGAGCN